MESRVYTISQALMETAELAALALAKQLYPAFDEVKYEEAVKIAGSRRWLDWHIQEGNIVQIRRGKAKNSPIFYSRLNIAAVKKAEQENGTKKNIPTRR